ncbi:hypothetical protein FPV67DRAFT_1460875 [Lyophyllum atratum]|nr:hypothetical protein FPV67DRAFT_1460875 [Lyophyllum atratum]
MRRRSQLPRHRSLQTTVEAWLTGAPERAQLRLQGCWHPWGWRVKTLATYLTIGSNIAMITTTVSKQLEAIDTTGCLHPDEKRGTSWYLPGSLKLPGRPHTVQLECRAARCLVCCDDVGGNSAVQAAGFSNAPSETPRMFTSWIFTSCGVARDLAVSSRQLEAAGKKILFRKNSKMFKTRATLRTLLPSQPRAPMTYHGVRFSPGSSGGPSTRSTSVQKRPSIYTFLLSNAEYSCVGDTQVLSVSETSTVRAASSAGAIGTGDPGTARDQPECDDAYRMASGRVFGIGG